MAVDDRFTTSIGDVVFVRLVGSELGLVDVRLLRGLRCRLRAVRYLVGRLIGVDLLVGVRLLSSVSLFSGNGFRHAGVQRLQLKPGFCSKRDLLLPAVLIALIGHGRR